MIYCTICGNKLEEQWFICPICNTPIQVIIKPKSKIIIPQQITTPYVPLPTKRTKRNKKKIAMTILLVVGFFIGGTFIGFGLTLPSVEQAEENRDYWQGEYNDLLAKYTDDLLVLQDLYDNLFADYEALEGLYEDPMTSHIIPTTTQVINWLATDDTDSHSYIVGEYMCGDFSVMLTVRARLMNWRMRICGMSYSYSGDPEYGNSNQFGEYGHAFNLIFVQDGSGDPDSELDVLFIEPQTDMAWFWFDGSGNTNLFSIFDYYGIITGTVWSNTFWVNSGSYHG